MSNDIRKCDFCGATFEISNDSYRPIEVPLLDDSGIQTYLDGSFGLRILRTGVNTRKTDICSLCLTTVRSALQRRRNYVEQREATAVDDDEPQTYVVVFLTGFSECELFENAALDDVLESVNQNDRAFNYGHNGVCIYRAEKVVTLQKEIRLHDHRFEAVVTLADGKRRKHGE